MGLKESKEVLNQAIDIAIQKGCFNLNDVAKIIEALQSVNELDDIKFGEIKPIEKK